MVPRNDVLTWLQDSRRTRTHWLNVRWNCRVRTRVCVSVCALQCLAYVPQHFCRRDEKQCRLKGIIHPEFMQCVTATGRLSSRNPNFQNMPRGNTFEIRKVVESRFENGKIIEGDYSQLEFRVAGFLAQDEQAYVGREGGHGRSQLHSVVIGCTRQEAKAHTFKPSTAAPRAQRPSNATTEPSRTSTGECPMARRPAARGR